MVQSTRRQLSVRHPTTGTATIDIAGEITAQAEDDLMQAFGAATGSGVGAIVLNFNALEYMNGGCIGLLVTLLGRARRQRQRVLAYGLLEHYRHIFELTRLDQAISLHDTEDETLAAAGAAWTFL